ncbi:MAG: DUF4855 domain-containing protein [Bacteroidales bacterium]|nr:DUF4855 domain-containing protein [Bacteroidales bacterium]
MKRYLIALALIILSTSACKPKEKEKVYEPAVRLELKSVMPTRAEFALSTIDAATVLYGFSASGEPSLGDSLETGGTGSQQLVLTLQPLQDGTDYTLAVQGIGPGGEKGKVVSLKFSTMSLSRNLYAWEKKRDGAPSFADISLVTLGRHRADPPVWTPERFASHVVFDQADGSSCWLYDAFLCIDSFDGARGMSYCLTNGSPSSVKESWEDLLEGWLGSDGAIRKLDQAVSAAAGKLGPPPAPRYVVMSLPDPVMFRNFSDKSSPTVYWGEVDGRQLDFSKPEDQVAAYRWYMNSCRSRFASLGLGNVELAGFYILSEELHLAPSIYKEAGLSAGEAETFNYKYKHWETIVPAAAEYAHSCNEGLWWIPYHLAPGHKVWKKLGFDGAFMQPNYYWDNGSVSHPMSKTIAALKQYSMGIELEFEYSLVASVMADGRSGPDGSGNPTFYLKDVPLLRDRVREYMQAYKDSGLYGVLPIAVYSGTDAMHQLASSQDEGDKQMYEEICRFIVDSPLKSRRTQTADN